VTDRLPPLRDVEAPNLWPDIERRIAMQRPTPVRTGARIAVALVAAALLAGLLAWALFGLRGLGGESAVQPAQPGPVTPEALDLRARTWVVPERDVAAFLEARTGRNAEFAMSAPDANAIVVRLNWTPQQTEARLGVVVIDGPSQLAAQTLQTSPLVIGYTNLNVQYGWDGRYGVLAERYPWLAPTADVQNPDGSVSDGASAVFFEPRDGGPMWIIARFPRDAGIPSFRPDTPPVVGVFLTGPDAQVEWAVQPARG
jgi:hypothetical protein